MHTIINTYKYTRKEGLKNALMPVFPDLRCVLDRAAARVCHQINYKICRAVQPTHKLKSKVPQQGHEGG